MAPSERSAPFAQKSRQGTPLVILLVDDHRATRRIVCDVLAQEGYSVVEADSGEAALRLAAEWQPDLILQDLRLPDCDAFDLPTRLREVSGMRAIPILAFSGTLAGAGGRVAAMGFDALLAKPVEPSTLVQLIRAHLPPPPASEAERFGNGRRIVVCNEDAVELRATRLTLERVGFAVSTAAEGMAALALVRAVAPVAIVADVYLPKLDGFGLCRAVRRDPALQRMVVVLATSRYLRTQDREAARRAGATAFVSRSTGRSEIIDALDVALAKEAPPIAWVGAASDDELEAEDRASLSRQLERQVSCNAGLAQQCSVLATKLSVLSAISTALVRRDDRGDTLPEALATCLDAIGATHGVIYVRSPDGAFTAHAHAGFDATAASSLASLFGHAEIFDRLVTAEVTLDLHSLVVGAPAAAAIAAGAGGGSPILVPLLHDHQWLGALLLAGAPPGLAAADWHAFGQAMAVQIATALLLARSFAAVVASEKRYRTIMESASDAIFVSVAESDVIVEVNPAAEKLLGRPSAALVGQPFSSFVPAVVDDEPAGPYLSVRPSRLALRADGTTVAVEISTGAMEIDGQRVAASIVRDVSAQEALSERLRLAQRMEAIGRFSGGVAHDFNNLLTVVLTCSDFLLEDLDGKDRRREEVVEIKKAGERAAALTRQMLAFSRRQVLDARVLDLNELIDSMGKMLRRMIGEDVDFQVRLSATPARVRADAGQLEQVLMNLMVNAREAMPQGGQLVVAIRNVEARRSLPGALWARTPRTARARVGARQRRGDAARDAAARVRSLFHDQSQRARLRSGAVDGVRHHQAERRRHLGAQPGGRRDRVRDLPAHLDGPRPSGRRTIGGAARPSGRRTDLAHRG